MHNFLLLVLLTVFVVPVHADIYKYVDSKGRVFFTDKPKHKRYQRILISTAKRSKSRWTPATSKLLKTRRRRIDPMVSQVADEHKLDPDLIHAIIRAESAYDDQAVSSAGAVGLMQLMPATAKQYGVNNSRDALQNIRGGARYLKKLLAEFKSNHKLAVAAYNAGENAVHKYGDQIPPYKETRNYVKKVMNFYNSAKSS